MMLRFDMSVYECCAAERLLMRCIAGLRTKAVRADVADSCSS